MFPLGRPSLDGRCGTYAIAAKIAHPDRPVIALVGDGAMQMNNMAELITVAKYWREWSCPNWVVCIFNNGDFDQVTWEQRVMEGDPKFNASQPIPDVPYHRFAESIGLRGIYLDSPDRLGSAWDEAPTGPWCWRSRPIRMCRHCLRISRSTRRRSSRRCWCRAIQRRVACWSAQ